MSDHVPSYARHDPGRGPPRGSRPPPGGGRYDDDRSNDRSYDRGYDRRDDRGYNDRRDDRFHDRQPDSPGNVHQGGNSNEWEYGVVVTVRDSFGFVRGFKRQGPQLFFHASEVRGRGIDDLCAGDEVKYIAREAAAGSRPSDRDGKANALDVTMLTDEDKAPIILAKAVEGTIVRALRGRTKMDSYGGRVEIAKSALAGDASGDGGDGGEGEGDTSKDSEGTAEKSSPKPTTEILEFTGKDLSDSCPRLKDGDVVSFDLVEHKFTGERRMANVAFIKHAPPVVRKVIVKQGGTDGSGNDSTLTSSISPSGKEIGRVEKLAPSYGFIRKIGGRMDQGDSKNRGAPPNPSLFFHYTQLNGDTRETDLNLGMAVSFTRGEDGRSGKPTAVNVSLISEDEARDLENAEKAFLQMERTANTPATGSDADRWGKTNKTLDLSGPDAGNLESPSDQTPEPGSELGVVSVMKANYGFIRCVERPDDLFFHFTEVRGGEAAVAVGRDVSFFVENRPAPGRRGDENKPVAVGIQVAPKGSAVFEIVEETIRKGVCVERLVFGRQGSYGDRRAGNNGGNGNDGGVAGQVEFPLGEGEDIEMFHDRDTKDYEMTQTKDKEGDEGEQSLTKPEKKLVRLSFQKSGLVAQKTNPRPGDVVSFRVRTDNRTKKRGACFVEPTKFYGTVVVVKQQGSYGFLEHDDPDATGESSDDEREDEAETKTEREDMKQELEPTEEAEPEKTDDTEDTAANDSTSKAGSFPKSKATKWEYESETVEREKKAAALERRKKPALGKTRVFFHGSDVEGGPGINLREGDEVEYGITLPVGANRHGRRGDGSGGGGKDPQARRVIRTKESPAASRPVFTNSKTDFTADPTGERPTGTKFTQGLQFRQATMPDGTRGFTIGRGKGLAEATSAAISKLKLDATPFAATGVGSCSPTPTEDVTLNPSATEDA